ncbi:MAG: hypothetical protein CML45_00640 [Rhodobacteraceae bacterium]|nr:hypothetical protein [Paracoccaceae bacterium]|tara:strand:- start:3433 stop:4704 length:1272 start_codon:yes stop_codon:yes gene_type:complete
MSYRKFGKNDVLLNTMQAHPSVDFFVYNGRIYFNDHRHESGSFSDAVLGITASFSGGISLYEYNIDRLTGSNNPIYPYITKDSAGASFKTVAATTVSTEFQYGDRINGFYPMTASISREFMSPAAGARGTVVNTETEIVNLGAGAPTFPHFYGLKNRLEYYTRFSEHYRVSSSYETGWNKAEQALNVIYVPSIFYGSRINPGTVSLKWYISGTLAAEVRDTKENGELIEVTSSNSTGNGSVAGVVMYNEGVIILTGSWEVDPLVSLPLNDGLTSGGLVKPKWLYFGVGGNDGKINPDRADVAFATASFGIHFEAETNTQVYTMFAKASRGQANYSNNPTYLTKGEPYLQQSGSHIYEENPNRTIKNTASSSFASYNEPFKRQVYISRVGIYDENKNLIGIATLANPVLKKEDEDLAFKIKLDI